MTASRWPLLELVQRLCAKLNAPKPSSLSAAELANSAFHADLVDAVYDAAQRLMLQINPDELYESAVIHTRNLSLEEVSCLSGNTSITWTTSTGTSAPDWAFPIMGLKDYDGIFELTEVVHVGAGVMTATLDRTFHLDSGDYDAYILTREVALPSDYKAARNAPYNITAGHGIEIISFNQLEEMRRTHHSIDFLRLTPGNAKYATINRSSAGTPYLMTYPSTITRQDIQFPYIKEISVYNPAEDDASTTYLPLPPHHQHLIIDAVLVEVLGHQLADGRENRAYYDAMNRLSQHISDMDSEIDRSRNETRVEPVTYRGTRRMWSGGRFGPVVYRDFDRE